MRSATLFASAMAALASATEGVFDKITNIANTTPPRTRVGAITNPSPYGDTVANRRRAHKAWNRQMTRTKLGLIPGTPGNKLLKKARLGQLCVARLR